MFVRLIFPLLISGLIIFSGALLPTVKAAPVLDKATFLQNSYAGGRYHSHYGGVRVSIGRPYYYRGYRHHYRSRYHYPYYRSYHRLRYYYPYRYYHHGNYFRSQRSYYFPPPRYRYYQSQPRRYSNAWRTARNGQVPRGAVVKGYYRGKAYYYCQAYDGKRYRSGRLYYGRGCVIRNYQGRTVWSKRYRVMVR